MLTLFLVTQIFACIEPPPTATEGGQEPSGAAKPGAPEPGDAPPPAEGEGGGTPAMDDAPNPAAVPEPHDGSPPGAPKPQFSQADLTEGVELSLSLACDGCTGDLLVRVENASSSPPTLATQKAFSEPGAGTILAPKGIDAVIMVVDDADKNGQPTPGERIGIWTGGLLKTSEAPALVELEVGKVPDEPPLPPAEDDPGRPQ